ncbi:hypothetical protein [Mesoplasma lactucae]|uniref:Uncharacterized protein n=1 Tax=Mesoplasma lactucae ATCC 49193 TaxID=81460 RepID=A0A291IRQ3_9MOLU|nr:hypothetical protein [Mesoplasma lactucae]ATG97434.1 hypothetical protein CP520_01510 [Mesoplasma lactucae ATCC 49193]ATZ20112.1 hypothetical protein MLACT_v1c02910 [Mesoplasma lactucae ATCC 49193]MCL8216860.1 hypothetical protein [Mesoplasma lactucae ATCC 49193]
MTNNLLDEKYVHQDMNENLLNTYMIIQLSYLAHIFYSWLHKTYEYKGNKTNLEEMFDFVFAYNEENQTDIILNSNLKIEGYCTDENGETLISNCSLYIDYKYFTDWDELDSGELYDKLTDNGKLNSYWQITGFKIGKYGLGSLTYKQFLENIEFLK